MATTNGSTAIRDKILASLARYRALRIGKFPCAFWRLSSRPGLTAYVFFNGGMAESLYKKYVFQTLAPEYKALSYTKLPSTSPAYAAMSYKDKLAAWSELKTLCRADFSPPV